MPTITRANEGNLTVYPDAAYIDIEAPDHDVNDWPGVADNALIEETCRLVVYDFVTPYNEVDLGTNGTGAIRWQRVGRMVQMFVYFTFDTDCVIPGGVMYGVHPDDVPFTPRSGPSTGTGGNYASPSAFGYLNKISADATPVGYNYALAPAIVNVGFPVFVFIRVRAESGIPAQIDNLWGPNNPVSDADIAGATFQAYFPYEAAAAL